TGRAGRRAVEIDGAGRGYENLCRTAGGELEALSFSSRKLNRQPLRKHRRGHHEDDEQHEHHVDEWRDVDLREIAVVVAAVEAKSHASVRRSEPVKSNCDAA